MDDIVKKELESTQHNDLFVKLPILILKIYLHDRSSFIGVKNNRVRDSIIHRIESVCKETIEMIKNQDFEK